MKTAGAFKPFRHLKQMLRRNATPMESLPAERYRVEPETNCDGEPDEILFARAMADVTPLSKTATPPGQPKKPSRPRRMPPHDQTQDALRELVRTGRGYRVAGRFFRLTRRRRGFA